MTAVENSKWLREERALLSLILVTEKQDSICEMSLAKFSFLIFLELPVEHHESWRQDEIKCFSSALENSCYIRKEKKIQKKK